MSIRQRGRLPGYARATPMPPKPPGKSTKAKPPPRPKLARARTERRLRLDVDERRSQLLELGLAEFGHQPYDAVSIELIAKRAEISKGLVYHYFPTKRAFYVACVREGAARLLARLEETEVASTAAPIERLHAAIDRYLEYVRAHGRAYATLMQSGVGADRAGPALADEVDRNADDQRRADQFGGAGAEHEALH